MMSIKLVVQNPRNLRTAMNIFRAVLPVQLADKDITPINRPDEIKDYFLKELLSIEQCHDEFVVGETSRMVFMVDPYVENGRDLDEVNNIIKDPVTGIFKNGYVEIRAVVIVIPPKSSTPHIIEEYGYAKVNIDGTNVVAQNEYDNPWNCHLCPYNELTKEVGKCFSLMLDDEYNKHHPVGIAFEKAAEYIFKYDVEKQTVPDAIEGKVGDAQEHSIPPPKRMKTRGTN